MSKTQDTPPPETNVLSDVDAIAAEVEAFYRAYISAFNREDIAHWARSFAYPYAFVSGRGLAICRSEADHRVLASPAFAELKSSGWSHSEIGFLKVWPIGNNHAMVLSDLTRYKKDGSLLESGRFCYTVRLDGHEWKIVTMFTVAEPFLGPGDFPRRSSQ